MADLNLNKMFVLVPNDSTATIDSIKNESKGTNKIYFLEAYNQIVAKGTVYGVDPASSNKLTTLINSLGATVAEDGTVTFDWTDFNYGVKDPADTLLVVLKKIDAALADIVTRVAKIEVGINDSKTLNWVGNAVEFSGSIKYVAAAGDVPAHIALVDEDNKELSKVEVSDIVGNGVLKNTDYSAETGILTLTFAQADGTEKAIEVDLKAMLDINDISIAEGSKKYLEVTLGTAEAEGETQAVFGVKLVKVAEATAENTGLADAKDVKDYVDTTVDTAIKNLDKGTTNVDGTNVHVSYKEDDGIVTIESVTEDYATVTRTNTSSTDLAPATDAAISVTDGSKLVTGADIEKVAAFAADKATEEAHRVNKHIEDTIASLTITETEVSENGAGKIGFKFAENNGKVSIYDLKATYAAHTDGKISEGIVDAAALNAVLADMWETYETA